MSGKLKYLAEKLINSLGIRSQVESLAFIAILPYDYKVAKMFPHLTIFPELYLFVIRTKSFTLTVPLFPDAYPDNIASIIKEIFAEYQKADPLARNALVNLLRVHKFLFPVTALPISFLDWKNCGKEYYLTYAGTQNDIVFSLGDCSKNLCKEKMDALEQSLYSLKEELEELLNNLPTISTTKYILTKLLGKVVPKEEYKQLAMEVEKAKNVEKSLNQLKQHIETLLSTLRHDKANAHAVYFQLFSFLQKRGETEENEIVREYFERIKELLRLYPEHFLCLLAGFLRRPEHLDYEVKEVIIKQNYNEVLSLIHSARTSSAFGTPELFREIERVWSNAKNNPYITVYMFL